MPPPSLWSRAAGAVNEAIKEYIPSNVRLLASTALGDRSPVTEAYFPESDLAAMRTAAASGMVRKQEEMKFLEGAVGYSGRTPEENAEFLAARAAKSPVIRYPDYKNNVGELDTNTNWAEAAVKSVSDADFRALTSIGQARLDTSPVGDTILKDEYSFHGGGFASPNNPSRFLDGIMAGTVPKGKGRDVTVNLGAIKPAKRPE